MHPGAFDFRLIEISGDNAREAERKGGFRASVRKKRTRPVLGAGTWPLRRAGACSSCVAGVYAETSDIVIRLDRIRSAGKRGEKEARQGGTFESSETIRRNQWFYRRGPLVGWPGEGGTNSARLVRRSYALYFWPSGWLRDGIRSLLILGNENAPTMVVVRATGSGGWG